MLVFKRLTLKLVNTFKQRDNKQVFQCNDRKINIYTKKGIDVGTTNGNGSDMMAILHIYTHISFNKKRNRSGY